MKEIERFQRNGYVGISTFSGAGGSSLGYKMAGFKIAWANEFIEQAAKTYKANHKNTIVDRRDIRLVKGREVLELINKKRGELDLMDGSPPCAAFSTSGVVDAGWGRIKKYSNKKQRVDDLFFEFTRLLSEIYPKVFVAENVTGLVKGASKGMFLQILKALEDCGYVVKAQILKSDDLGVPQARDRVIFIGVRKDLGIEPIFPTKKPYKYTIFDAMPEILKVLPPHIVQQQYPDEFLDGATTEGKEWDELKIGVAHKSHFTFIKPDPFKASPTIVAALSHAMVHPYQRRRFTSDELKILSSFPKDFILTGSYANRVERIGRAVPPLMMKEVALCVKKILDKANGKT